MPKVDRHEFNTPAWMDLTSPDLEKARAFYGGLLGWTFLVGPPETAYYTMCQLGGQNVAGMGKQMEGNPFPPVWSVYFSVEDADTTADLIKKNGGQVVVGPMDVMESGRLAFCADPTGAHFGLWQPKNHPGAGLVNEPGAMTWHEVATRDAARARDFYAAVFGLAPQKMEGMEYWTLHKGEKVVCGVLQMDEKWPGEAPAETPPHWMGYFAVEDADAAVQKVAALGGKVRVPPFDTPYGRMSVVSDPFDAVFSVIKLPKSEE